MPDIIRILRAAAATGASIETIIAIVEAHQQDEVERRRKDAARQELRRKAGPITYEMRLAVYDRDGWKCVYCEATEPLTCDHVVAINRGGLTTLENLATACKSCNSRKQDRELKHFKRALARQKAGNVRRTSDDVRRTSSDIRQTSDGHPARPQFPAAGIPPVVGPLSAEAPGIDSVDNTSEISEKGLTAQRKSPPIPPFKESVSFLPIFTDSSHSKEKKEVDTRAREAADSLFAKFWQAYPHKVGKRDAANCWKRVIKSGIVGIDDLMSGLARYAAKSDDRPWCNPATWLNGGRWDDQPAVANGAINGRGNGRDRDGTGTNHPKTFAEYAHQLASQIARDRAG